MRRADWQAQLAKFVATRAGMPFAWGENDCCLYAADAVFAMTGRDFAGPVRGTYLDARQALQVAKARGGLKQIATDALGAPVPACMAAVGDIVLLPHRGAELLAVCNGTTAIGPGAEGTAVLSMESALAAWRV